MGQCPRCGAPLRRVVHYRDVFRIKVGRPVLCGSCQSRYCVSRRVARVFGVYYRIMWTLEQTPWMLMILLGAWGYTWYTVASEVGLDPIGGLPWLGAVLGLYGVMEWGVALVLPLYTCHEDVSMR